MRTANVLRRVRPTLPGLTLDEIRRDVISRHQRSRRTRGAPALIQRRVLALTLFVALFAISTSNAAATVLNVLSGGTLGKTLGVSGKTKGTQFFFGALSFGGDKSDDAARSTYCPDDGKGSDGRSSDDGRGSDRGSSDDKGSYSKSSTTQRSTTIKVTTTTRGGGQQGSDNSSSDGKNGPCAPRDHSDSDGKDSDGKDSDGKYGKSSGGKSSGKR